MACNHDINKVEKIRLDVARIAQDEQDMQRHYETKLTEMAQDREAARPTNHAKALQEESSSEELKDRHSDDIEKLRQEVARMEQEKKKCCDS